MNRIALTMVATTLLVSLVPALSSSAPSDAGSALPDCDPKVRPTAVSGPTDLVLGVCSGIRPGAGVTINGAGCTMSWILKSGSTYYATIAGHCGDVGDTVKAQNGTSIGTFIYSVNHPIGEDFGIFEILSTKNSWVNPAMCAWGGPTGMWTGGLSVPVVRHFGFGVGIGSIPPARARTGVLALSNASTFGFEGAITPGDSGSPARLMSGEALGVITDLTGVRGGGGILDDVAGEGPLTTSDPTMMVNLGLGTRLDHGLAQASAATGITFTLQTAPLDNEV